MIYKLQILYFRSW